MLFVHFVDGVVLDGEQHKPLRVLGQDRLFLLDGGKGGTHANSNDYIASLIAVINQIGRQFNFDLEIVLLNFGKMSSSILKPPFGEIHIFEKVQGFTDSSIPASIIVI